MNSGLVLCLAGILLLAGFPLRADNNNIVDPSAASNLPPLPPQKNDPLTRYKNQISVSIGSRLMPIIDQNFGKIPLGKVHIQFTIHSDGNISELTVLEGKDLSALVQLCLDSIKSLAPFKPFDEALTKEVGEAFVYDFNFKIYR